MNTTTTNYHAGSNWIAFLFGAVFNVLPHIDLTFLIDYILQAIVGGLICLGFKILGDILSPLWLKQKQKVRNFTRARKIRISKRRSHDKG
ncbi:hypothetical protein [Ohtaekwangia koreensis]|uniref:Uncharacterized protein n=1 Tax=Ohtaekwangia koreensis TaxID=688867 RepID=A0A1T5J7R2_9BACT|nr:hypothetical protein [Ohtaekwangia koreensis]SKC47366.1 hypothetical protein SAMN05660236_0841 [Ohtaekwangia koreensis]